VLPFSRLSCCGAASLVLCDDMATSEHRVYEINGPFGCLFVICAVAGLIWLALH
jgi:hypothetical protein